MSYSRFCPHFHISLQGEEFWKLSYSVIKVMIWKHPENSKFCTYKEKRTTWKIGIKGQKPDFRKLSSLSKRLPHKKNHCLSKTVLNSYTFVMKNFSELCMALGYIYFITNPHWCTAVIRYWQFCIDSLGGRTDKQYEVMLGIPCSSIFMDNIPYPSLNQY